MRSRVICQIHDSIIGDVHRDEQDDYLAKVKELVTIGLPAYWPWINVPMTIEAEVAEGNWFLKKEVKL
jgi:DNA polymerase I-like protein with 3'-5' exonuclease and polymerase domains